MWKNIHKYTTTANIALWKNILKEEQLNSKQFSSLRHTTCMKIVESILKIENKKKAQQPNNSEIKISKDEQKAVRYVAGYIIYSLTKNYKKLRYSTNI